MSSEFDTMSAIEMRRRVATKEISPVELTRRALAKAEATQPTLNSFYLLMPEQALAAAKAAEEAVMKGAPLGAIHGIPFSVKDLMAVKGVGYASGSRTMKSNVATLDAPAVERAKAAGGILIGKTTTSEFGCKPVGDSPLTGITRNPWDLARTPGGSSSGAAAACAAGIGPLHLGSDGAGSIRIPCAFTGLFGMKPSYGRVPAYPLSPMGLLAHLGPIARTVADAALMLTVLSAPDHRDPYALPPEDRDYLDGLEDGVRGWRIAYSPTLGYAKVDPEISAAVAEAARKFAALGAVVEEVGAIFPSPRDALFTLWAAGAGLLLGAYSADQRALVDPGLVAT